MTSPISDERLKEILEGCEGVTPGPWNKSRSPNSPLSAQYPIFEVGSPNRGIAAKMYALDACHIARLDPATVASIVTELLAAREALSVTEEQAAYGLLWRMRTTDKAIHQARWSLLQSIGKDGQRAGLEWALRTFGSHREPTLEELP